jgi:hypothetical protein
MAKFCAAQHLSLYDLHCPGHTALQALVGVGPPPPHSLQLSLCDFCMFGSIKKVLKGYSFGSDNDFKVSVVQFRKQ